MLGIGLGLTTRRGGGGTAPAVTLIYDSFTAADATLLTAHTPDTINSPAASGNWSLWTRVGGTAPSTMSVISNRASSASKVVRGNQRDAGASDITITAISDIGYSPVSGESVGIQFRQDAANAFNNRWAFSRSIGAATFSLIECSGGVFTTRASAADSGVTDTVTMKVVANGTTMTCYRSDVELFSYTSSVNLTNTHVGFSAFVGGPAGFDDFTVTA